MQDYLSPEQVENRWISVALAMVLAPMAFALGWVIGWHIAERVI